MAIHKSGSVDMSGVLRYSSPAGSACLPDTKSRYRRPRNVTVVGELPPLEQAIALMFMTLRKQ